VLAGGVTTTRGNLFSAKGLSLILLAFFFPLAIYLLVLGVINRRGRPLLVSGVWDGIGLVFGASGFLLFAGPAIFSSLRERWRTYWLFGQGGAPVAGPDGVWQFWIFLSLLYFALILGGTAYYFWRQRNLTSIYNVEPSQVEQAVMQACEALGLNPVRSGGMFLFGLSSSSATERSGANGERATSPHYLSAAVPVAGPGPLQALPQVDFGPIASEGLVPDQKAILELDSFPLMRHVTLRWDPTDSPLRQSLEGELSNRLAEMPARESLLGGWLLTLGCLLLSFEILGAFAIVLLTFVTR
jgi:hypothetical protein